MNYTFQFGEALKELPYLLGGAIVTLEIAFMAFWSGAILGLAGAYGLVYGPRWIKRSVGTYITFFTNTPSVVQIFFLFYALPEAGILLSSFTAVTLGLALNSAAYLAEIQRAGFLSVRQTEIDAAETLGMSRFQMLRYVIVPHIARTIYPPLSSFFIWLVLGSSIGALYGVEELTGRAINIATSNLRTIEIFLVTALIYVVLTLCASVSLGLVGRYFFRVKGGLLR
ncbi:amino acid ABC transporter permease [Oricola sp.]|uniref:amino acid ABC transporter permease n=1 Tax=Oricola sp. TaxID=1979950 RepID=UPI0025FF2091|nr:amino acid ABC transporter permease [Oricola sp.]MCI5076621.1 amino acid ABC transporter permease [Oricola sp.]